VPTIDPSRVSDIVTVAVSPAEGAASPRSVATPKSSTLTTPVRDFDVGRFQVAVNDAVFVSGFECKRDLSRDREDLVERKTGTGFLEALLQRRAFHQFQDETTDGLGIRQPVNRRDVRMIERGKRARLAIEACQVLRAIEPRAGP
jgi:hypothetical protein